ncbi:DNA topoisomerase III [Paenibacillus aurantius]|uniref:DNA topoisomerase n=1 Tax=Paenibacillus aurantius TaxID=2918900 RepID=A0AA96LA23_9BACL|nr:DNA topoisomerase III [Paenibacillus aurantius]WNQ09787.1 DNA topoisomerase III [Paenibacillus aurantius]
MKTLVLAEKPSVAKELARVLGSTQKHKAYFEGPRYVVTWALGHLVTLAEPEDYDHKYKTWNLDDLPILPGRMKLKVIKETSHQFRAIEQLCRRSDLGELVIATDAGREGELVARWIMELVNWKKPFKRLWISSQTDKAIQDGFAQLKPGHDYDRLYQSAVCRSEADWLIGLNITRALTSKYNAQLAAGRVQTPTLATMIRREQEIKSFQQVEYWTVSADFETFQAQWRHPSNGEARIFDKAKAEDIRSRLTGKQAQVVSIQKTDKTVPPPLAYDLTELQRDANKRYGFSAKQTSNLLQKLYEQHKLVTYPRTDSRYLTSDMVPTLKGRLESIAFGPYASLARTILKKPLNVTKRIADDSKVSDHHAIIPTEQYLQLGALSSDERKLYDLIARRFIALFYPPLRYEQTSLVLEAGGEKLYASGKVIQDHGWKEVYGASDFIDPDSDEDGDDSSERDGGKSGDQTLPPVQKGDKLPVKRSSERSQYTKPPARYTEASLLSQMEKNSLGTPATRADIIEKLLNTDTIQRQGSHLVPTGKGLQLIELAAEDLRSQELTARWEQELERIAKGQGSMKTFLEGIREQTIRMVQDVKKSTADYKPHNLTHSHCPECQALLQEVKSKRGRTLVCSNRECGYRRSADPVLLNKRCPQCHKKMEVHTGKAGRYAQCRGCNVVEVLDNEGGGRKAAKTNRALVNQYADQAPLSNPLAEALKAAMDKNKEK